MSKKTTASNTTATFVKKYIKSPRFFMCANYLTTLALNTAILISLITGGYKTQYMLFPIIFIATDVLFLAVSAFSNFRFKYTAAIPWFYLGITIITTALTFFIVGGDYGTRLFTHLAIVLSAGIHLLAVFAWVYSYIHASSKPPKSQKDKRKHFSVSTAATVLCAVLIVACLLYGTHIFHNGWFGQGALGVERTVEYSFNKETDTYDVVGLASDRGDTVVIPESFNGKPVGKIDCSFAEDTAIKNIYFESKNITTDTFISASSLYSKKGDRTIYGKVHENTSMPLQTALLELARTKQDVLYFELANITSPYGLSENQIFVTFAYNFSDLHLTDGNFFFLWVGEKGEAVPSSILDSVPYLRYLYNKEDPENAAHLVWAYDNANKHIFTGIDNGDFPGFDTPIEQSYTKIKFNFEPLIKLTVEEDNDTVYTMNGDFAYQDAETKTPNVFTVAEIDSWFEKADTRSGFDLSWEIKKDGESSKVAFDTTKPLSEQINDGAALYPTWTMRAPEIKDIFFSESVIYGETARFDSATISPSTDFMINYEWRFNDEIQSSSSSFSIENTLPSQAGTYTLTVTALNPAITSLTASDTAGVSIEVTKRALKLDWILPDNPVYTASDKCVSWSVNETVSTGIGVINGDSVTLKSDYQYIRNAGDYTFVPSLNEDAAELYYIKENAINTFTISPAPLFIEWGSDVLTYNAEDQLPEAIATGLGSDGEISLNINGAIRNTGVSKAIASITDANYRLENAEYDFTVIPCVVDVTWNTLTHIYDAKSFNPTATSVGFEADGVITFTVKGAEVNVGTYGASVSLDTTGNYIASEATSETEYSITKRKITVYWLIPSTVEYTGYEWYYTTMANNVVSGENVSFVYTYTNTEAPDKAPVNAGSYGVSVALDPDDAINANYELSGSVSTPITIKKVKLNLVWSGNGQIYDTTEKTVRISSYGVSSPILIEQASSLIEYSGHVNTLAGNYTAYVTLTSEENFIISSGNTYDYEILKRTVTPIWNEEEALAFVYDGEEKTVYVTLEGIHESHVTSDIIAYDNQTQINAGENYIASITIINDNYCFSDEAKTSMTYTVAKRTLDISWSLSDIRETVFDGNEWTWVYVLSGEVSEEYPTITFTYHKIDSADSIPVPVNVGDYRLIATLVDSNETNKNYVLANSIHDFTVTPKQVFVDWVDTKFIFNGANQKPSASYTDILGSVITLSVEGEKTDASEFSYTATAISADPNYVLANPTESFTIEPLRVDVIWGNTAFIYNGADQKPKASYNDVNGYEIELTVSGEQINANSSVYVATAHCADSNYSIINDTESFTIAPLPVTVTWDNISFIYNGTAQKPVASYYNVEGVVIPLTVEGEKTDVSASDYTATAVCSDTNYELINPTESFNILPLTVEVIWGNREFIFNGANQKPEAEYIDVNGDRIALSVSGEEINASETAYVAVASASDANYSIINTSASFTISPLPVTVIWGNAVFTYDGTAKKPVASYTTVEGDTMELTVEGEVIDASSDGYTATAICYNTNYTLVDYTVEFTILPMQVNTVWGETTFTYNGEKQTPTAYYTDVNNSIVGLYVHGGEINASKDAYSALAICTDNNYTLLNSMTDFVINPKTVDIVWGVNEFVYNGEGQIPTAHFIDVSGIEVYLEVLGEKSDASPLPYTATSVCNDTNYTISNHELQFTISPLSVEVIWGNASFTYNGKEQLPVASYTDVNGETVILTVSGAQINASESNYTATASNTDTNYTITGETCEFAIAPMDVDLVWESTELIYNGNQQKPVASYTDVNGETVYLTVNGEQIDASGEAYSATASETVVDTNYNIVGEFTVSFTISPKSVEIKWENTELIYNGNAQQPTASYTDVNGETVYLTVSGAMTEASSEPYIATAINSDTNYTITGEVKEFTIAPLNVDIVWEDTAFIYNGYEQKPTASYTDVNGETVYLTVSGAKINASDEAYIATASEEVADTNYNIVGEFTASFTISQKMVSVIWGNTEFIYNSELLKPDASFTDVFGETVSLTVTGAASSASDTPYTAYAHLDDSNYILTNTSVSFTISSLDVKIVWSDLTFTYDGSIHQPSAVVVNVDGNEVDFASSVLISITEGDGISIGKHTAAFSFEDEGNYNILDGATCEYEITHILVTVTWESVNGVPIPTVAGAPEEVYIITYWKLDEFFRNPVAYTEAKFEDGNYSITIALIDDIYAFAEDTSYSQIFSVSSEEN